jgi:hypothetical protein
MREPGVRRDANVTLRDRGRLVATGYDLDKRLHLGFPVVDLETVQDRGFGYCPARIQEGGKRRMLYGLDLVGRPVSRLTTRNSRFLFWPGVSFCCPTSKPT